MLIFSVVTPCETVMWMHHFGGIYYLHLLGVTTQKTHIDIFTSVKTSNLTPFFGMLYL
jgi:hypothetical protein